MSAIAGIWYRDGRPGARDACARIVQAQALYGPHRSGLWDGGEIALGHGLMRLLPEDRFDRQPLLGRGGRLALVADARIDNRDELVEALGLDPALRTTMCDAAYILAALERWGEAALDRLTGDFAFAAWDAEARRLLLARDHLDGRPLHYHLGEGWIAFASMPKGLLALPEVPTGPDPVRLLHWQMLHPLTGPRSFHRGVSRLEPGRMASLTAASDLVLRRHWQPEQLPLQRLAREADYADGLREHLDRAVAVRLRSDTGVASTLSAGLDSGAVTTSAAATLAVRGRRLTAFTAVPLPGTPAPPWWAALTDEGPLAAQVAARYPNIDHHLVRGDEADLMAVMEKFVFLADQPVLNPLNTAWMHEIYRQCARRKLNVVLFATKGNLALSYSGEHVVGEHLAAWRPWAAWRDAGVVAAAGLAGSRGAALRSALWPLLGVSAMRRPWRRRRMAQDAADLFPGRRDALAEHGLPPDAWRDAPAFADATRGWRAWFAQVLSTADAGPMNAAVNAGHGIDRRDPTSDRRLIEFCLTTPTTQFLRQGRVRDLYWRAFGERLPPAVRDNRLGGLQAPDWRTTLRNAQPAILEELAHQADNRACSGLIDIATLQQLTRSLGQATDGRRDFLRHNLRLGRGLSAGLFIRKASGGN